MIAHFQQIDSPGRRPGTCWLASLYRDDRGDLTRPLAIAWVSDYGDAPTPLGVILDYILVPDEFRRMGFATRLIRECEARWPGIWLTEPISEAGEGLLVSLSDHAAATGGDAR